MSKVHDFDNFGEEEMSNEVYKEKYAYVAENCKCSECPSYVEGDDMPAFCFPLGGTSKVIKAEKGCICDTCPISVEFELNHAHYCTRCSQLCQTYKDNVSVGP